MLGMIYWPWCTEGVKINRNKLLLAVYPSIRELSGELNRATLDSLLTNHLPLRYLLINDNTFKCVTSFAYYVLFFFIFFSSNDDIFCVSESVDSTFVSLKQHQNE